MTDLGQFWSLTGRDFDAGECLILAKKRHSGHVAGTSAYPPTGDIRWPMSVIVPISSALPLKADVAAVGRESPKLTQLRHSLSYPPPPIWAFPSVVAG